MNQYYRDAVKEYIEGRPEALSRAIIRENAAAQACAMELRTFGDVKFTADEYKESRTHRMQIEAN